MSDKQEVIIGEYKGKATISLPTGTDRDGKPYTPFTFGVAKAKLIMYYLEDIEKFIQENRPDKDNKAPF